MIDISNITRALAHRWIEFNRTVFKGALLHPPVFVVKDVSSRLAEWSPELRHIMFSESCLLEKPWNVIIEVLKHEMAHQYVTDVLKISDETSHGPAFRRTCKQFGIDHRAAHKPSDEEKKTLAKVAHLLNLANSSEPHEAQAALAAAHKLLGRSGLTEEDARPVGDDEIGVMHIGPVIGRIEAHHSWIASILSRFFHVQVIWSRVEDPRNRDPNRLHRTVQLEICGRSADLALAEHVHEFLHSAAERMCPPHIKHHARLSWKCSFVQGFYSTLKEEEGATTKQLAVEKPGLVLVTAPDKDVTTFFRIRYPRIRHGGGGSGRRFDKDGWSAGRGTKLQRPLNGGPKLLPAKT